MIQGKAFYGNFIFLDSKIVYFKDCEWQNTEEPKL